MAIAFGLEAVLEQIWMVTFAGAVQVVGVLCMAGVCWVCVTPSSEHEGSEVGEGEEGVERGGDLATTA